MKKGKLLWVMLGMVLALGMSLTGCAEFAEVLIGGSYYTPSSKGSNSSGCPDSGDCVIITDANGAGAYKTCSSTSCAVSHSSKDIANANVRCDCNR
ncbi:hypothetical protein AGMMS49944_02150 [Spirochaetia bacterium]|nr:hypothetical protein AGMMS49944_02150 [Spirochaetia bacterium]